MQFSKIRRKHRIHKRIRKKVKGTPERPRLCVYRSNKEIYAQLIDDINGITLASASSLHDKVPDKQARIDQAKNVGKLIAEKAKSNKIENVVFDRGGYLYHGRVKALAEGAREAGLHF